MRDTRQVIWAPWRKGYVIRPDKDDSCVFCRALESGRDRENLVLARREFNFVILNRFPYNNGHLMIVPNRHVADLSELGEKEAAEMMALSIEARKALGELMRPAGFNLGINIGAAAGAGIAAHLHLHLVPRWPGDTNFMPVTGAVKAIPDSLDALYGELQPLLAPGRAG